MMTIDEMRRRKAELGLTYGKIAMLSGIPVGTVQKILGKITRSPGYGAMEAIERVLRQDTEEGSMSGRKGGNAFSGVRESPDFYHLETTGAKEEGNYTLEDYLALPDERRVEMIDGVFYDMPAPSVRHQRILGGIYRQLYSGITMAETGCEVFFAPLDVQLDDPDQKKPPCDVRTIVEPDVLVICEDHKDQIGELRVYGAPDFVIEILSPSTRKKNMTLKLGKYEKAGVREYWMVDPDREKVIVYTFGEQPDVTIYGWEDKIPVGISDGTCSVCLQGV